MALFFVSTSVGLAEPLELELKSMGINTGAKVRGGVFFDGNWADCYKVNLKSRLASRVLKPVHDFTAYQPEELYGQVLRHDFTKYIDVTQTFAIDASVRDSMMRDQRFLAMKTKDAICDQFRDKTGARPDIDSERPDLRVHIRGVKNKFNVAIDTSGDSLFMRGYRLEAGDAPLKENLAAGLLALSEWDQQTPIVDPMCGSGTILIEAALMASKMAAGSSRKRFGFETLKGFDKEKWNSILEEAADEEIEDLPFKFYGYDIDGDSLRKAKANARRAGVDHLIEFKYEPIATLTAPVEKGLIITNPPYGARIGDEDNLRDVYRDLSHTLKHNFKGWNAWILSGNKDLITDLKLKSTRKHFVFNGPLECRFLKYEMF